ASINNYQQQSIRKITTLPLYSDDYDNIPNGSISNLSTPINHKQIPIITANYLLDLPNTNSSILTTSIPSPESHVPLENERRRSISPPLPPQMSPDNGRPLPHLTQNLIDEHIDITKRLKTNLRSQNSPVNTLSQQQSIRKSPIQQLSSSSSSSSSSSTIKNPKRRSPSPPPLQQQTIINTHSRHRTPHNSSPPTSSSES
ncbi:unnamed protein product, partial [Rotaria sp. Silwood1]